MTKFLIVLFACLLTASIYAQTTGSFEESVVIDEIDYEYTGTFYYHVPEDYDPEIAYKLVVGFRGGPHFNAGEFRDELSFFSDSLQAIVVCPENIEHFWNQEELTKQLFKYSLVEIMGTYNIDPDFVYLTGLSFGGRHAVIVSMDTEEEPIANLRGVIPFAAGLESQNRPNYPDAANFPPSCICIGANDDISFETVSNELYNTILDNNGQSYLNVVPFIGHSTAFETFPDEMMECIDFIESTYSPNSITSLDNNREKPFVVFPNPATDKLKINVNSSFKLNNITLKDVTGRTVLIVDQYGSFMDVSGLQSGIYYVVAQDEFAVFSQKIVIQKD